MTATRLQASKHPANRPRWIASALLCALLAPLGRLSVLALFVLPLSAQPQAIHSSAGGVVQGTVVDTNGNPVPGALVHLVNSRGIAAQAVTTSAGSFIFSSLTPGAYTLSAANSGLTTATLSLLVPVSDQTPLRLTLQSSAGHPNMQFSDAPNFAIAGVTDWTAVGGHGSDSNLRTSEELARDTVTLGSQVAAPSNSTALHQTESQLRAALAAAPGSFAANHRLGEFYLDAQRDRESLPFLESAWRIDPTNRANLYDLALACRAVGDLQQARTHIATLLALRPTADAYRLAGKIEEQSGNPLAAVRDEQKAVDLDPSEPNYFTLGSELLLHRAIWQSQQVFRKAVDAWPHSLRMQTALGAALFAGALYDEAAQRLCVASDLDPAATEPYLFMGKIEIAAPAPLPCIEQKLARFAAQQPANSSADYLYAMAILKSRQPAPPAQNVDRAEALFRKAVASDPSNASAWFELGNLAAARRDYQAAIDHYRQAIEADPRLTDAYYRLAVAYDRSGDPAKAKQEFLLHDQIAQAQQQAANQQRKKIQQFLFEPSTALAPAPPR